MELETALSHFCTQHKFARSKGALCLMLVVSRHAKDRGLPLDPAELVTENKGQVLGLGKSSVQKILKEHNITKTLAEEGGRTSRGSIGNMQAYVEFLNRIPKKTKPDVAKIEAWWVARIEDYFKSHPLQLRQGTGITLRHAIAELLETSKKRQAAETGTQVVGAVYQHLVGAKLETLYPKENIHHHGCSVADAPTSRGGDFLIGDTCIHVTTHPTESLIAKCQENIAAGLRPLIVTSTIGMASAINLGDFAKISDRLRIFELTAFLEINVSEWGNFSSSEERSTTTSLIETYNRIVSEVETDPGLQIAFK